MSKWLLFFSFISIVNMLLVAVLSDIPEKWRYGQETGNIIFSLSSSFVAAFLFYLVDVWLPEKRMETKIKNSIIQPLSIVFYEMERILNFTAKRTLGKENDINIFENVDINDLELRLSEVPIGIEKLKKLYNANLKRSTILDGYADCTRRCMRHIETITSIPKLDPHLFIILNQIRKSSFHNAVLQLHEGISKNPEVANRFLGATIAKPILEYYNYYVELQKYTKKHKIKVITIDEIPFE